MSLGKIKVCRMPQSDVSDERFEKVLQVLKAQAEHLLAREARLGRGMRLIGKSRISDDELFGRFKRLREQGNALGKQITSFLSNHHEVVDKQEIWPRLLEVETALTFVRFSNLANDDIKARLGQSWNAFDALWLRFDCALNAITRSNDTTLSLLTSEELKTLADMAGDELMKYGNYETFSADAIKMMADLVELLDRIDGCASEARSILAGRFDPRDGSGRPVSFRGDRLSALLLGMAAAMLSPNKTKLTFSRGRNGPPRSAADAVAQALSDCADVADPAARAVLDDAPKTYETIVRYLITKSKNNEVLLSDRHLGEVLGRRLSESDIIQSGAEER